MGRNKSRSRNMSNASVNSDSSSLRTPASTGARQRRPQGEQQMAPRVWEQIVKAIRALDQPAREAA